MALPAALGRQWGVERLFQLTGLIAELRVGGRVIETTAEHPFYVPGQGWKKTCELEPGDHLVGHDGTLTPVEEITLTERTSAVYNLRVAQDHTYFVGDASWGFSIWAHNTYHKVQNADGVTFDIYDDVTKKCVRHNIPEDKIDDLLKAFNKPPIRTLGDLPPAVGQRLDGLSRGPVKKVNGKTDLSPFNNNTHTRLPIDGSGHYTEIHVSVKGGDGRRIVVDRLHKKAYYCDHYGDNKGSLQHWYEIEDPFPGGWPAWLNDN